MSKTSRYWAFGAYLLSIPGAIGVLLIRRDDPFAVFHARQSLRLATNAVATLLIWTIVAWVGAWIPVVGPLIGLSLFALVIAIITGLTVSWVMGMILALRGRTRSIPFAAPSTRRRRAGSEDDLTQPTLAPVLATVAVAAELIETPTGELK